MKKTITQFSSTFNKCMALILGNGVKALLICLACGLMPSIVKADTPIPTSVVSSYDPALHRLTLTVNWTWGSTANDKYVTAAVFADLNGDGISPTYLDNPATYTSGGNPFPAGLSARDEFLGQLAISTIEGTASSSLYPEGDSTDNGIAAQHGFGPSDPRVLFPYGLTGAGTVGDSGTFKLTYDNVFVAPTNICVVLYDVHKGDLDKLSGSHSPRSANPGANTDNSVEDGNKEGTVSCGSLVVLRCAVDKTEASCQSQAAVNASYAAFLASVTASGCNGVLTNNSTGAPSATGGSKTVTFKYTQSGCKNQAAVTTCTATFTVLACNTPSAYNPDINVTYVNVQVPGNVSTNDKVPAGSTYGTPVLNSKPTGSTATINLSSNGSYTFIANTPGVYVYNVPVCSPGQTNNCPTSILTITVLSATDQNPPVANTDIATTKINTAVSIKSLANDRAGNPGGTLNPASVMVVTAPKHGTATVDVATGNITYTPAAGFTGMDTLTYSVCDNNAPALCATAKQIITVYASGVTNTTSASDDYANTSMNTPVSGNVKTNDTDAEGNTQTVNAQTTTVAGKGTLVLNSDGTFTFTPVSGFNGPVSFVYTTCDNGVPQACASATLYITVGAVPDLTPRINLNPNNVIGTSPIEITVQVNELNNVSTNGSTITLYVDKLTSFSNFTFNNAMTTNQAGQPVQNSQFMIDAVSDPNYYVITTNAVFQNGSVRVAFSVKETPGQTKGTTPVNVYLKNGSGGETNFTNNTSYTTLTFSF